MATQIIGILETAAIASIGFLVKSMFFGTGYGKQKAIYFLRHQFFAYCRHIFCVWKRRGVNDRPGFDRAEYLFWQKGTSTVRRTFYYERVSNMQSGMITFMAEVVENRDDNTGGHIKRTAKYVERIAKELKRRGVYSDSHGQRRELSVQTHF